MALTFMTLQGLLFYRPLPAIDGYYRFLGLDQQAEVVRDVFGIPRIEAGTLHDLFFLQGYVTAQDRFAQMEAMRASVPGTPFSGPASAPDERAILVLDAYAAGVTKYIDQQAEHRALPAEIALRGERPRPWTPLDSLAVATRYRAAPPASPCRVVDGGRAFRGAPMLAAELTTTAPEPGWYEIGLGAPGLRGLGISLPGVPGIVAGHNGRVAWSILGSDVRAAIGALQAAAIADVDAGDQGCAVDDRGGLTGAAADGEAFDVEALRVGFGTARGGPSARMVIDLGDLDASRAALSTGQSGHPVAFHYRDQAQLWSAGQLHRLAWTPGAVARTEGRLVLRPR
ncbi:MAG TPA: penicillin acylase family protein [Candidatus Limnocylindrales bacterium]|nr:penicillin acylase family protein [Candidatus Limnocylindrales bacterium]